MNTLVVGAVLLAAGLAALGTLRGVGGVLARAVLWLLVAASVASAAFCLYAGFFWTDRGAGLLVLAAVPAAVVGAIAFAMLRAAREGARIRALPQDAVERHAAANSRAALGRLWRTMQRDARQRRRPAPER